MQIVVPCNNDFAHLVEEIALLQPVHRCFGYAHIGASFCVVWGECGTEMSWWAHYNTTKSLGQAFLKNECVDQDKNL